MRSYLCNGEKYLYSKGYIHLPTKNKGALPKAINIDGNQLSLKSSFHVSLLCIKNILAKNKIDNLEQDILNSFCKFVSGNDISFTKFNGEFRFVEFEERKTVIARCDVSNLEKFSQQLSQELDIEIPTQPTHITLYTFQTNVGIGINSFEELDKKSRVIDVPSEVKTELGLV